MPMKCDEGPNEAIKEILNCVVELHVTSSTDTIKRTIQHEVRGQSKETDHKIEKLIDSQNAVIGAINTFSTHVGDETDATHQLREKLCEEIHSIANTVQKTNERADRSERISYETRGKLGAQERKRRKVDLDEISRLRNEVGVLKRQNRDKDNMIKAMSNDIKEIKTMLQAIMTQDRQ